MSREIRPKGPFHEVEINNAFAIRAGREPKNMDFVTDWNNYRSDLDVARVFCGQAPCQDDWRKEAVEESMAWAKCIRLELAIKTEELIDDALDEWDSEQNEEN